jgi:hypothetical protein
MPEVNRQGWVEGAAKIVRAFRMSPTPAVQKVTLNADEFAVLGDQNNVGQLALALGGRLNQFYGSDSGANQVELVVHGNNPDILGAIQKIAWRNLNVKVTLLTGEKLRGVDVNDPIQVLQAAGVAGNLAEQKVYVLTSQSRENAGQVVYQQVNDRVLDVALALFSYTRFASPADVFKAFSEFFKLPSLSSSVALQALIALQA